MKLIDYFRIGADCQNWYYQANLAICELAYELNIDWWILCDYLALFSPRVHVKKSVRLTVDYLKTGIFADYTLPSVVSAVRYYEMTGTIRGLKSAAFANALKCRPESVVLDIWMCRALRITPRDISTPKKYAIQSKRVIALAGYLRKTTIECQAAVWGGIMRKCGRHPTSLADCILSI